MERFIHGLNGHAWHRRVTGYEKLPEADHDFRLDTSEGPITVQLTELVEREYAKPISMNEQRHGKHQHLIQKDLDGTTLAVDIHALRTCLTRAIQRKLDKHYSKPDSETLWLVMFCTSTYLLTEYYDAGQLKVSDALVEARRYLRSLRDCIFDEIWYTNLQTRPIRVWPVEGEQHGDR